jgi:UTP:GlnB (protein PII) uridylyltransferase
MSTESARKNDEEMAEDETSQVISLRPQLQAAQATTVRFIEGEGGCSMLEVETSEGSGFVRGLSRALLKESVQIVRAEVKRVAGGVVDRFTIAEHDGSPIRAAKRLALQVAVMAAVDLAS